MQAGLAILLRLPAVLMLCLLLAVLAGCEAAIGPVGVANGASLALTRRSVPDLAHWAATGRDCSIARLDAGQSWCKAEPQAVEPVWCTRSLGAADCWSRPPPGTRPIADPPPRPQPGLQSSTE